MLRARSNHHSKKKREELSEGCFCPVVRYATMRRFESSNATKVSAADAPMAVPHVSDLSSAEIEGYVAHARAVRSAYFAAWCKRVFQTWASVWRRPGRMVPHAGQ